MSYKNVIMIASQGNNVGKTTTAKLYKDHSRLNTELYSFASPIRDYCNFLFKNKYNFLNEFTDFYKHRSLKDDLIISHIKEAEKFSDLNNLTFRDFINYTSDEQQETKGVNIWGQVALENILAMNIDNIVIDDFRRVTEGDYLKNNLDKNKYNVISVNLIKEDVKDQVNTHHEGLLTDYNFDIVFKIEPSYTNLNDLFKLIDEKIKR